MRKRTKVGIVVGFVTVLELMVLGHYNAILSGGHGAGKSSTAMILVSVGKLNLPPKPIMAISDDKQVFAYVDGSNVLRTENLATHSQLFHLQLNFIPDYLAWIGDQSLFIGTQFMNGSTKSLRLSTIDIQTGKVRLIQEFDGLSSDATFRQIAYSNYTNDVYVLIGDSTSSVLYHFDTNGNMNVVDDGGRYLSNIGASQTDSTLYFQDFALGTPNLLQEDSSGNIQLIERNGVLLRVINNTLYFAHLNAQGDAVSVQAYAKGKLRIVAILSVPSAPDDVFVDSLGKVYLLSPSGVLDVHGSKVLSLPNEGTMSTLGNAFFVQSAGTLMVGAQ